MLLFAPEEFFFGGEGGQIGVRDGCIDIFTDLEFLCITRLERHICCNLQNKIEIFPLTIRQLCKHRRVRLERLLYSFRCLELRHCTGSKLSKKQTRQRVTTEVYNMLLPILGPLLLSERSKCSRLAWVSGTQVSYAAQIKRKRQCA